MGFKFGLDSNMIKKVVGDIENYVKKFVNKVWVWVRAGGRGRGKV